MPKITKERGARFNPSYVPSKLKRWKASAKKLQKDSVENYNKISAYIKENEKQMTTKEKENISKILGSFNLFLTNLQKKVLYSKIVIKKYDNNK